MLQLHSPKGIDLNVSTPTFINKQNAFKSTLFACNLSLCEKHRLPEYE